MVFLFLSVYLWQDHYNVQWTDCGFQGLKLGLKDVKKKQIYPQLMHCKWVKNRNSMSLMIFFLFSLVFQMSTTLVLWDIGCNVLFIIKAFLRINLKFLVAIFQIELLVIFIFILKVNKFILLSIIL
jgi:hypothetical protein